ncbi:MAG: hypothetical protein ICV62_08410 [Cyanobacteria bacterium Co-bin13]|nr:hypothetical protein [Cyanobacteria bacterium Co-bin13]
MSNYNSAVRGLTAALLSVAVAGTAGLNPTRAADLASTGQANQTSEANPLLSQTNADISENVNLIGQCRQTNRSTEVFSTSSLGPAANRVGTLTANSQVTLTGVVAPGRAQVYRPDANLVGWVNAAFLAACATATTPQPAAQRVCYRAEVALSVRTEPTINAPLVGTIAVGEVVFAANSPPNVVTAAAAAPNLGRQWVQITFEGTSRWIARTGPNQVGSNVTQLPAAQCRE